MRTSTKILIATLLLLVASLAFYDLGLRTEYLKGNYTDPYREYMPLNYKDFNEVDLNSSTAINIILVKGPFKVMAAPGAMDFLKLSKKNNRLIVDAAFGAQYRSENWDYILYISCPSLAAFKADARYTAAGNLVVDTAANEFTWKPTLISGFTADSLNLQEDHAANVILENNKINNLNARIGIGDKSRSDFTIGENNFFTKTNLAILNKSRLWVKGTTTNNLNYQLADSATLVVNGASVKHLLKLN
jgi:hypothetical protein